MKPGAQRDSVSQVGLRVLWSADRGVTWQGRTLATVARIRGGCPHDPTCRVKVPYVGLAADGRNRLYAVYTSGVAGQPYRLELVRSDDRGLTWSSPVTLAAAPRPTSGDLADAEISHVVAAGDGLVYVVWVDDRAGPRSLWAKRSADAGRTWSADLPVSALGGQSELAGYYGDYGGVAIDDTGALHLAWGEGNRDRPRQPSVPNGGTWYGKLVK